MEKTSLSMQLESKHRNCKEIKNGMGIEGLLKKDLCFSDWKTVGGRMDWTG